MAVWGVLEVTYILIGKKVRRTAISENQVLSGEAKESSILRVLLGFLSKSSGTPRTIDLQCFGSSLHISS
jgi:hypothetical protein